MENTSEVGRVGDTWHGRPSSRAADGRARWPLAGDQLFVDLDLSEALTR